MIEIPNGSIVDSFLVQDEKLIRLRYYLCRIKSLIQQAD